MFPAKLSVRPAEPDDAYEIVRINVHGWQRAYVGMVPDDVLAAMEVDSRVPRFRDRLARAADSTTLVATRDGTVVGYVHFGPYRPGGDPRLADPRIGEVMAIYVDPPAWGTGAGRELLTHAVTGLTGHGCHEVRLWVLEANHSARRFYARAGFVPDGGRAGYPVRRPDGSILELTEVRYALRVR